MSKPEVGERARALVRRDCALILQGLAPTDSPEQAIHSARKAIRRLRALLALMEGSALDLAGADSDLQQLGDSLSDMRDAYVVAEAAERLHKEHPGVDLGPVVAQLSARSERVMRNELERDPNFSRRHKQLADAALWLDAQSWQAVKVSIIKSALALSERRAHKSKKRAADGNPEAVHRWRRRVRRLRMQLEVLPELGLESAAMADGLCGSGKTKALHKLSDALGWQQDLRMLRNLVRPMPVWDGKASVLKLINTELSNA